MQKNQVLINYFLSNIFVIITPDTKPQNGDPIFKKTKSDIVIKKAIKAPKEQLPEKATIKVFFKTSSKAIPPNVEINAGGQVVIKPVKKGEKIPNIIHNKENIIAPV
jgi:hypothetical protein